MIFKRKKLNCFTLIELSVVVVVILILSTFLIINLNGAKAKTRDQKRISDAGLIASALDQYSMTNARLYPPFGPLNPATKSTDPLSPTDSANSYKYESIVAASEIVKSLTGSSNSYLDSTPLDPLSSTSSDYSYVYIRSQDGKHAAVIVNKMETSSQGGSMCNIPAGLLPSDKTIPDPVRAYLFGSGNGTNSTGLTLVSLAPHPTACYYVAR